MAVHLHPHALERMAERGVILEEVKATVEEGESFAARFGRTGFRRIFPFDDEWRGVYYQKKQVEVYAVREDADWLVLTVITRCL